MKHFPTYLVGVLLGLAGTAHAAPIGYAIGTPVVTLQIDNSTVTRSVTTTPRVSGTSQVFDFDEAENGVNGTGLEILGTFNPASSPDPFISFTINAANFASSDQAYMVLMQLPISSGRFATATSSFGGTLTDLDGDGVASSFISDKTLVNSVEQSALTLGTENCEAPANTASPSYGCGSFGPATVTIDEAVSLLSLQFSFTLTRRDTAEFDGSVGLAEETVVPEPTTLALLGGGVLATLGLRRRHRRPRSPEQVGGR